MLRKPRYLTNLARANRQAGNPAEMALWSALRPMRARGLAWRRQHPIAGYLVDFCCLRARVIVEVDGATHDARAAYDRRRETELVDQGFEMIRYGHRQVLDNASGIAEFLEIHCDARARILFGDAYGRRRDASDPTLP